MIPGEYFVAEGEITLNADREAITLMVASINWRRRTDLGAVRPEPGSLTVCIIPSA